MKTFKISQTLNGQYYQLKMGDKLIGDYCYYEDIIDAIYRNISANEYYTIISKNDDWKKTKREDESLNYVV